MLDALKRTVIMTVLFLDFALVWLLAVAGIVTGFIHLGMTEEVAKLVATIIVFIITLFFVNLAEAKGK